MKIVVFSEKFWPEGSGAELATYLILKSLATKRHGKITIYTSTPNPAKIPNASIHVTSLLRSSNKIELFYKIIKNKSIIRKLITDADVVYIPRFSYPIITVAKEMKKHVVVHLHDYQPVSFTAVVLSSEKKHPMNDFQRTAYLEGISGNLFKSVVSTILVPITGFIRRWISYADSVICVSHRHKEIIARNIPELEAKLHVVYNPPPEVPDIKKELSETPTLLYTGGDSYIKGFQVLLEAMKILGRKRYRLTLYLTNNYTQESVSKIMRIRSTYGLDIKVLGRIKYEKLLSLYAQIWALIFPSIYEEPLPYTPIESSLLGTIPISSRVGGVLEIFSNTSAASFLVEPGKVEDIVTKIIELISKDKKDIIAIGNALRNEIRTKLDTDKIIDALCNVICVTY